MAGGNPYKKTRSFHNGGRGGGGNHDNNNRNGGHNGGNHNNSNNGGRGGGGGRDRGGRGGSQGRGGRGGGGGGSNDSASGALETVLKLIFEKHSNTIYNPENGMLNLADFQACEDLKDIKNSVDFNSQVFCRTLVSVIQTKVGNPRFINFNGNGLRSLHAVLASLIALKMHESIGGLSFQNNQLSDLGFIGSLKKFTNLQELVLSGNPVRKDATLVVALRKKLPGLLGLDGEPLTRLPLGLPWPQPSSYDATQQSILQMLEGNLLGALSSKQMETVMNFYHEQAVLSFTLAREDLFSCRVQGDHKDVQAELGKLRQSIQHTSRSLTDIHKVSHIFGNRIQVAATLQKSLYHNSFNVFHVLNSSASVVTIVPPIAKVPTIIVTVHGRMQWQHPKLPQEGKVACFDRTVTLTQTNNVWTLCNDAILLRPDAEDALYSPSSQAFLEKLERTTSIPREVLPAVVKRCNSDQSLAVTLAEIGDVGRLAECCRLAGNDFDKAVMTAIFSNTRQIAPQDAFQQLSSVNFVIA